MNKFQTHAIKSIMAIDGIGVIIAALLSVIVSCTGAVAMFTLLYVALFSEVVIPYFWDNFCFWLIVHAFGSLMFHAIKLDIQAKWRKL